MRDRYLDLLRAIAVGRVLVYHVYGWAWLTFAMPAMGVMFAIAGSLTAASLARSPASAVVGGRLRRLLPPLWLLGAVALPVMAFGGWRPDWRVVWWVLPLGDPVGSDDGLPYWEVLWYLRAYLWFLLLSPVLFRLYRRAPWPTVALPLVLLVAVRTSGFALPGAADNVQWDLLTYGACWVAGFAHRDGRLAALPRPALAAVVVLLSGGTVGWLLIEPVPSQGDLDSVPGAQALWSLAFVLVILRRRPAVAASPVLRWVNTHAVTIYLWHNPMIFVAGLIPVASGWTLPLTVALTGVAVLVAGPVERAAARWSRASPAPVYANR
ncbi:membrane protein [Virgisporangium aliadipatigenens]|uniref:Membrane protein n=1 Tax=Virgisporangium aliadipatigenens TaxID=741659 RepID=A0A8J3YYW5_9ACTN|nr:acyltransferase [Virgisporangium aliadipatigenens]GIJ52290.1 membrane protein [Virgisporangium aliadipatigenens]